MNECYRTHAIERHVIRSTRIDQAFSIRVLQPVSRADGSERFPVVYVTDGDEFFGACAAIAGSLQFHGETPRFILVGIGYEDAESAGVLRMRDFYLPKIRALYQTELEQFARSPLLEGRCDLRRVTETTGAAEFLGFLRDELMPFVTAHYPIIAGDSTYSGYSAGGGFGLYVLLTQPDTFRRYVLGSPVTSHHGYHFGIEMGETFVRSGRTMHAQLFMSVGELEEFKRGLAQFDFVSGYYRMAKYLRSAAIPGLDLTFKVFPGETHATAWMLAFTHGLKALLGPVDQVPFWPEYLK